MQITKGIDDEYLAHVDAYRAISNGVLEIN